MSRSGSPTTVASTTIGGQKFVVTHHPNSQSAAVHWKMQEHITKAASLVEQLSKAFHHKQPDLTKCNDLLRKIKVLVFFFFWLKFILVVFFVFYWKNSFFVEFCLSSIFVVFFCCFCGFFQAVIHHNEKRIFSFLFLFCCLCCLCCVLCFCELYCAYGEI